VQRNAGYYRTLKQESPPPIEVGDFSPGKVKAEILISRVSAYFSSYSLRKSSVVDLKVLSSRGDVDTPVRIRVA